LAKIILKFSSTFSVWSGDALFEIITSIVSSCSVWDVPWYRQAEYSDERHSANSLHRLYVGIRIDSFIDEFVENGKMD
jgi:hypothetical protein